MPLLQEWFLSEYVLLKSRYTVQRVERLFNDLPVSVSGTFQISDVDELVDVPAMTERCADRSPVLHVWIKTLPYLPKTYLLVNTQKSKHKNIDLLTICASHNH